MFSFPSDGDGGGSPWWTGRGDFAHPELGSAPGVRDEELSDASSGRADGSSERKKGAAQFTEYSITSSVVPRSEGTATRALCVLHYCHMMCTCKLYDMTRVACHLIQKPQYKIYNVV